MKVRLAYRMTGLEVNLPENVQGTVLEPRHVAGLADPRMVLRDALRRHIGTRPLRDLVRACDRVGIVVGDMTRPVPNHLIVSALLAELGHVRPEQITLFGSPLCFPVFWRAVVNSMAQQQYSLHKLADGRPCVALERGTVPTSTRG